MPAVPDFFGSSGKDAQGRPSGSGRLVNMFWESAERGPICRTAPGMEAFATLDGVFLRAMETVEGRLVAVHGGRLWSIDKDADAAALASVDDSAETTVAGLLGRLLVVADGAYSVWDGSALTTPTPGAFEMFGSVSVMAQRAFLTERGGRKVQWSAVADPSDLDPLDFATAEQRDDLIVRAFPVGPEMWVFKQTCIERWYPDGTGFAALPGSLMDVGLRAFGLAVRIPGGAFFIGSDGRAHLAGAGALRPISTPPVETAISERRPVSVFHWRFEGHEFCTIAFEDRPAWCCDIATGRWWERAEGLDGPWAVRAAAVAWGRQFVGRDDGRLSEMTRTVSDLGEPMVRRLVSRSIDNAGARFRVARLEVPAHVGRASLSDEYPTETGVLGADEAPDALGVAEDTVLEVDYTQSDREPEIDLRVSRDAGQTWGAPQPRGLGARGDHDRRVVWRSLGQGPSFTAELTISAPVDVSVDTTAFVELA